MNAVRVLCRWCTRQNEPGAARCSECDRPLLGPPADVPEQRTAEPPPPAVDAILDGTDDETTRLLTAAVHRHEAFGDAIIREYLVEEVGAVPPSPGLDAVAVLRDAVAARARRRLRDSVALVLLAVLLVLDPIAVIGWAAVAVLARNRFPRGTRVRRVGECLAFPAAVVLLAVVVVVKAGTGVGLPMGDRTWWPSLAVAVALLAVLMADQYVVRRFLTRCFHPSRFTPDLEKTGSVWERRLRGCGQRRYAQQLARVAAADEHHPAGTGQVDVIVHRGSAPFVGAGFDLPPEGITVPARKQAAGAPFDVYALHQHLATELRKPAADANSVLYRQQIMIPADALVFQYRKGSSAFARTVLPDLDQPPLRHLPPDESRGVAQDTITWARYYSCFREESWSRNLAVSCYLYVTVRQGMVQLDLTSCVLPPILPGLDEVDHVVRVGNGPPSAGAAALLALPLTTFGRVASVFRPLTPRTLRLRGIRPERYGAGRSLREGVSTGLEGKRWYESRDARDMVAARSRWLLETTARYLKDHGYDVSGLRKQVSTTINNSSIHIAGGNFVNTNISNDKITTPNPPPPESGDE